MYELNLERRIFDNVLYEIDSIDIRTIATIPCDEFKLSLGVVAIVRLVQLQRDSPWLRGR
jgi:hypothetical protein